MDTPKAGLRQRIFAWALARFNTRYERFISKYKQELFRNLTGTVLEIGPGTGAAPQGSWLRSMQNLLTPLWKQLGDGCHPNRETWVEVERAGFETVDYDRITAPTLMVAPQIVGMAMKAVSPNNIARAGAIAGGSS